MDGGKILGGFTVASLRLPAPSNSNVSFRFMSSCCFRIKFGSVGGAGGTACVPLLKTNEAVAGRQRNASNVEFFLESFVKRKKVIIEFPI